MASSMERAVSTSMERLAAQQAGAYERPTNALRTDAERKDRSAWGKRTPTLIRGDGVHRQKRLRVSRRNDVADEAAPHGHLAHDKHQDQRNKHQTRHQPTPPRGGEIPQTRRSRGEPATEDLQEMVDITVDMMYPRHGDPLLASLGGRLPSRLMRQHPSAGSSTDGSAVLRLSSEWARRLSLFNGGWMAGERPRRLYR